MWKPGLNELLGVDLARHLIDLIIIDLIIQQPHSRHSSLSLVQLAASGQYAIFAVDSKWQRRFIRRRISVAVPQ